MVRTPSPDGSALTAARGDSLDVPELPTLDPGVTLLSTEERATGPLQALVLDHLLLQGGEALWVDSHGHAQSQLLGRLAPSRRVLDRVRVARGFTPTQHATLVERLPDRVTPETSLVVLPAIDGQYRGDELPREDSRELFLRSLATVGRLARERDLPVLVTRRRDDEFGAPAAAAADATVACERTEFGPRFRTEAFETLVYPGEPDGTVQTTLAYWTRILAARDPVHGATANPDEKRGPSVSPAGAEGVR
jgi:hypothetical protein